MSIFNHNIYDNVRTRVIVFHAGKLLLLQPLDTQAGWRLPGGGLEPNESLAECGEREVLEETGITVKVTSLAFSREWVVPKYCVVPDGDGFGFGLEMHLYADVVGNCVEPRVEHPQAEIPHWMPISEVPALPLWPKELKTWALLVISGRIPKGVPLFVSQLESPDAPAPKSINFP